MKPKKKNKSDYVAKDSYGNGLYIGDIVEIKPKGKTHKIKKVTKI